MRYFVSALTDISKQDAVNLKPFYPLQLLCLTILKENGEHITFVNDEFNPTQVSAYSLDNFLGEFENLKDVQSWSLEKKIQSANALQDLYGMTRSKMKKAINLFIGVSGYLYGHVPYEDFLAIKSVRGNLDGFFTRDLKQMQDEVSEAVGADFSVNESSDYPIPTWYSDDRLHDRVPTTFEKCSWEKDLYDFLVDFIRTRIA